MKFFAPLALAAVMATGIMAQDSASSTSAEASSTSSASSSSVTSTSASSSSSSSSSSSAASGDSGSESVCEAFPGYAQGTIDVGPVGGCTASSTSIPPYDASSLQSYLIGQYSRGPEGVAVEDVASQLAQSVTRFYPTLTMSFSDIASQYEEAIDSSISAIAAGEAEVSFAAGVRSNSYLAFAGVAAAVVAGGAFVL